MGSTLPVPPREFGLAKDVLHPQTAGSRLAASAAHPESGREPMGIPASAQPGSAPPPHRIPRWLVHVELFLRVMLRMYIGIAVCYAPWSHTFWDQNPVFAQFPTISIFAANGAVRGIVSGLGLLNLWFAIQDALQHRER